MLVKFWLTEFINQSINQSIYWATKGQRPLTSHNIQYTMIIMQDNVYNILKNHASEKAVYKLHKIQFTFDNEDVDEVSYYFCWITYIYFSVEFSNMIC